MRVFAATTLGFAWALTGTVAAAQPSVTIEFDSASRQLLEQELGLTTEQLTQLVDDELRALYGLVDVPTFLRLSANAQGMANKGLGIDYASNVDGLIFGVALTVAADAGDADVEDFRALSDGNTERVVPVSAGVQLSVMAGYSVYDRLTVYVNGLYYRLQVDDLEGTFYNVGLHAQYKVFAPKGKRSVAQWGGLDVSTGIEVSRMGLDLDDTFDASGTLVTGVDLDTVSTGTLELVQTAISVPLELTTNATLLYFLTLYGGVALDLQFGSASMAFDLDTELVSTDTQTGVELDLGAGPDPRRRQRGARRRHVSRARGDSAQCVATENFWSTELPYIGPHPELGGGSQACDISPSGGRGDVRHEAGRRVDEPRSRVHKEPTRLLRRGGRGLDRSGAEATVDRRGAPARPRRSDSEG